MKKLFFAAALVAAGCVGRVDPQQPPLPGEPALDSRASTVVAEIASATADGQERIDVTVTLRDTDGNSMAGQQVLLTTSGAGDQVAQPSAPTDANGVAIGSITSTRAEPKVIRALVGGVVLAQQLTVKFHGGQAAQVAFVVQPSSVAAGVPIAPAVVVAIEDALGNPVSSTSLVKLTLVQFGSGATLSGTTTVAAVNGQARFANLAIDRAAASYRLHAECEVLVPATSALFSVTAAAPAPLVALDDAE
ncbi:MAG TPA: Ig-like domain-containing protein [Polyangia bacterium]|nr:Ig-like domain-containing protein [Polyangia bacterium]